MSEREIKFRAWDGEQMVSPDYIDRKGRGHWTSNSVPVCTGVNSPDVLMQFTGLVDEERNEVFEGDIVQYDHEDGGVIAKVVFKESDDETMWLSGFAFEYVRSVEYENGEPIGFEVIGNIYEHPELLSTPSVDEEKEDRINKVAATFQKVMSNQQGLVEVKHD